MVNSFFSKSLATLLLPFEASHQFLKMIPSFIPSSLHFLLIIPFVSDFFPIRVDGYEQYDECAPFKCGGLNISYPFWGNGQPDYCGLPGLKVDCSEEEVATFEIPPVKYRIVAFDPGAQILKIARMDLSIGVCPGYSLNTTLNNTHFKITSNDEVATLFYNCDLLESNASNEFPCSMGNIPREAFFTSPTVPGSEPDQKKCNISVVIPVLAEAVQEYVKGRLSVLQVLREGFEVQWVVDQMKCMKCRSSGGRCGLNMTSSEFNCFCPYQAYLGTCPPPLQPPPGLVDPAMVTSANTRSGDKVIITSKVIVGVCAAVVSVIIMCLIFFIYQRCKINQYASSSFVSRSTGSYPSSKGYGGVILMCLICFFRKKEQNNKDVEAFIRNYGPLAPKRYTYSDVKRMTGFFKDKLGQGGYGGVYKGKLHDGRLVAVKVLKEAKGNGEEFINEVASISRTSHVNIVTLLGYCFQADKRVLIYEFMPNGSLDKFVHNKKGVVKANHQHLGWKTLYEIAVGVARGLEYLHRGCNTRIVHFDIKPHNILLDENFRPKISDFGLAKLCKREESILSMLGARGTIGYIAPEVFSRNFGGVSHKSDVYSYGMMVLEMAGGTEKCDSRVETESTSDLYFPHWIYKRLELGNESEILGVSNAEDAEILQKMTLVGLWCIQTNPSARPSISKVIEMLEGSIDTLTIPPKPFLSSPPRPPLHFSTTSSMTQHDE